MKAINNQLHTLLWLATVLIMAPLASYAQERIAFETNRDGNYEVYSMKPDGSNPLRLTNHADFDGEPSFSRDGSKLLFTSTRDGNSEVYIMNPDGTNQRRLTNSLGSDGSGVISPDGTKIAFISARSGNLEVWMMNLDGSGQTQLTSGEYPAFSPSFSPDGSKLLYNRFDGNDPEIFSINVDGTNETNVTNNTGKDDRGGSFSPDGSKIVYEVWDVAGYDWDIAVMNADGSDQTILTTFSSVNDQEATFSPDGNHISFTRIGEIWVMTYGGAGAIGLTDNGNIAEHNSTWSPANVAPLLEDISIAPINEGDTATLRATINDPNPGDSFKLLVAWGEGGQPEEHYFPAGTTSIELTHVYEDDIIINTPSDNYQVIMHLHDLRFGLDIKDTHATVNNLDPTISNLTITPETVTVGKAFELKGSYDDAGYHGSVQDEALSVTIDFGDGQVNINPNVAPGPIHIFHTYQNAGSYTIKVKVTDNDQGVTINTIPVVVQPPAPPAAPTNLRIDYIAVNRVQIAWTDGSTNEDGFVIERCSNRGCNNFVAVNQVSANTGVYLDANLFANTQYYYRVKAFNLGGSSEYSNVVSAKTLRR